MIKEGTIWQGNNKKFVVLHTIELEGHTWVHYREHDLKKATLECKEYSCYLESFLVRFNPLPE
jgi:hypothetical protein